MPLESIGYNTHRNIIDKNQPSQFGELIAKIKREIIKAGLYYDNCKEMESAIEKIKKQLGNTLDPKEALQRLMPTVTHFARDDIIEVFEKKIGPYLEKLYETKDRVRILVAGCSSGEETYTLAMLIFDMLKDEVPHEKLYNTILATDFNAEKIVQAQNGQYLANIIPAEMREHFDIDKNKATIHEQIKKMIRFGVIDLKNMPQKNPDKKFDLIICSNVLMHYKEYITKYVLNYFYKNLNDNGMLKVGAGEKEIRDIIESTRKWKTEGIIKERKRTLRSCEINTLVSFVYRKK